MSAKYTHASGGFTLIELMICVAVVALLLPGAYQLHSHIRDTAMINTAQATLSSDAGQLTSSWRRDVSIARLIALAPEGNAMTLYLADPSGTDRKVFYEINAQKQIKRRLEVSPGIFTENRLASDVENLRFVPLGKGYRMEWGLAWSDGIRILSRTGNALATPICTGEAGK